MLKQVYHICLFGAGLFGLFCFVNPGNGNMSGEEPSPARTPTEELASFQIEPGLKIQLVASEPMVQDPVVTTFDAMDGSGS
jgi:hypothetical protein